MESLNLLVDGLLAVLSSPTLLVAAFIGCFIGTVVGILPGLGPSTTIALLIPIALTLDPSAALIMAIAVYLGAMYGGTLTAVLVNVPGEPSSVMAALDGYQMARQGRAGAALAIAAIGSFIGGTVSVLLLASLALPLADLALRIGPSEYFAILILALVLSAALVGRRVLLGWLSIGLGLLLATVGMDLQTGVARFTFGQSYLLDGIDLILPIIGVFGIGEVLWTLSRSSKEGGEALALRGRLWPSRADFRASGGPIARATGVGFIAGLLPGSGSTMGSFLAYTLETRLSKKPERFGRGAVEGVAAAETANNASTGGALVPMLTLGIPGSGATAVLLVYLIMYGIQPGPTFFTQHSDLAWAVIGSLLVSNIVLLILNLPLIPLFVRVLDIPARFMLPGIVVIALIGGYSVSNSIFDAWLVLVFGIVGFLMRAAGMQPALLVIGLVLGEFLEPRLRQALSLSRGDWGEAIFGSAISIAVLVVCALLVVADLWMSRRRRRRSAVSPPAPAPEPSASETSSPDSPGAARPRHHSTVDSGKE